MSKYLDMAATTPVTKEVMEAMQPYFSEEFYNPSAGYTPSFEVSKRIEEAKERISYYLSCDKDRIFFTSGASESNSWAFQGWLRLHPNGVIITTNIEHASIMRIAHDPYYSDKIIIMPVSHDGTLSPEMLDKQIDYAIGCKIAPKDILVAVQYANNEIGTIQDIETLSKIAHDRKATFFTDATQAFADGNSRNLFSRAPHIDMLSMSGHKIGAAKGVGILYSTVDLPPLIYGSQNNGMRGGTENVAGIIGLGAAFRELLFNQNRKALTETRDNILTELNNITPVKINGVIGNNRLPNNINVTFEKPIIGTTLMSVLSALGVYISVGSACSARESGTSHVLQAIGLTEEEALRTIRITIPERMKPVNVEDVILKFNIAIDLLLKNK